MNTENHTDIQDVIDLAFSASEHKDFLIDETPAVLIPKGYELRTFPEARDYPRHTEQTVTTDTAIDWLAYWNRFADQHSTAFFDVQAARLIGVMDYHSPSSADWCRHQVVYECPVTPEWQRWKNNDGKRMNQAEFARFIEDAIPDITDPSGAEMLEIATSLQVHNKSFFRQAMRLDNDETQFTYEENLEGKAGAKGQLTIPQTITLGVRLFQGGPGYALEARFRYSLKDGGLTMWYDLVRPERVHEAAVLEVLEQIKMGMTAGHLLRGRP
jgi:uncharacterized protein YfdQ (DUF2303 family)